MAHVEVDFAWEEKIQEVLAPLEKHGGRILSHEAVGPGGGNPRLLLDFKSEAKALDYLRERYPDDSRAFCLDRIAP